MASWPADKVERRAVANLVPYTRNARTHREAQVAQIAASIREWGYILDDAVTIGAEDQRYFERLEDAGVKLTMAQKRWWVKKAETLGGDMKREYPATLDEAFKQALEGAYFAQDLFAATKQRRIGGFPYDPRAPVQTIWDLGRNDLNTIWLPRRSCEVSASPRIVARPRNKLEAIAAARTAFARCQFDEQACGLGLQRLRGYRKERDGERGVWKDRPRHEDASRGADAFLTFACSGWRPPSWRPAPGRSLGWVV